jgi:hypothetical protein
MFRNTEGVGGVGAHYCIFSIDSTWGVSVTQIFEFDNSTWEPNDRDNTRKFQQGTTRIPPHPRLKNGQELFQDLQEFYFDHNAYFMLLVVMVICN